MFSKNLAGTTLAVIGAAATLALGSAGAATASTVAPVAKKSVTTVVTYAGFEGATDCMTTNADGALTSMPCDGSKAQQFTFSNYSGDGTVRDYRNRCVTSDGVTVWLDKCNGASGQVWQVMFSGQLRNPNLSMYLQNASIFDPNDHTFLVFPS